MRLTHIVLAVSIAMVFGVNTVAIKIGTEDLPPLLLTALRFVLVGAILAPFCPLARDQVGKLLVLSVTFGLLHFGLLFIGIAGADAATAGICMQLGVPFGVLLGAVALKEDLGWRRGAGLLLAFAGVVVLAGEPSSGRLTPILLLVTSAFAWAVSNLLLKTVRGMSSFATIGWISVFSAPLVLAISLVFETDHLAAIAAATWRTWAALLFVAVVTTILAYGLWSTLLRRYPMAVVVPFQLLVPVAAMAAGVAVLGEPVTWQRLVGGAATILGVAIIQRLAPIDGVRR